LILSVSQVIYASMCQISKPKQISERILGRKTSSLGNSKDGFLGLPVKVLRHSSTLSPKEFRTPNSFRHVSKPMPVSTVVGTRVQEQLPIISEFSRVRQTTFKQDQSSPLTMATFPMKRIPYTRNQRGPWHGFESTACALTILRFDQPPTPRWAV
jgi:hypothetical protein